MHKLPLLIIFASNVGCTAPEIVYLEAIPFDTLTLLYKRYAREIYVTKDTSLYYKVWDHDYLKSPLFLGALKAGFFDGLAPLVGIIYDSKNRCRGYVATGGISAIKNAEKSGLQTTPLQRIAPIAQQTNANYIAFYKRLLNNSIKTQYAFVDLAPQNIIEINTQFYLIDLESVQPFCSLEKNVESDPGYNFCIAEYAHDLQTFLDQWNRVQKG